MSSFYNNLPFPLYLGLTFLVPIFIMLHFFKNKSRYPSASLIGMIFLSFTGFSAGSVRIFEKYQLFDEYSNWFGAIPAPFILLTMLFLCIGLFQKGKHDPVIRKKAMIISILLTISVLFVVYVIVS